MKCVRESKLLTISRSRTAEPYHYTEEKKKKSIPVSHPKNFAFRNGEQSKTLGRVKRHQLPAPKKTQSDSTLAEKGKRVAHVVGHKERALSLRNPKENAHRITPDKAETQEATPDLHRGDQ